VETASETRCYCFINADIILTSSIMQAIPVLTASFDRFLLGASPWNMDLTEELTFATGWEDALERRARAESTLRPHETSDIFLYPRGFLADAPGVVIGRCFVDNGLMWFARKTGAALIDGTPGILTVHQNHHYGHLGEHASSPAASAGALWNLQVMGGRRHLYTWRNATHHYTKEGLQPYWAGRFCHWASHAESSDQATRALSALIWTPLARITRPIRRLLGLTNPRY
jgi:hypothetical protein